MDFGHQINNNEMSQEFMLTQAQPWNIYFHVMRC